MSAHHVSAPRLYLRYLGISLRAQLEYRASFLMQTAGHFFVTAAEFAAVAILFSRFDSLGSWTLPEVAVFYGLVHASFAFADALGRGFDLFGRMVKSGDFDRLLLRPRSTVLQLLGQEVTLRRAGRLAQALAVFGWGAWQLGLTPSVEGAALIALSFVGNLGLFTGLVIFQATMAFWTVETLEIVNSFTYGGVQASQVPMAVHLRPLRRFFTYVIPLAASTYYPVVALLGRVDPLGAPAWAAWVAPLAGPAFLVVSLLAWRLGVRHYTSTGS